jgi:site-specific DNA recombinase
LRSSQGNLMSTSNYQTMFKNPFYYGLMDFNGELHEGIHEPIISKRLFDQVQEVMQQKSKPKTPQLKPYLYRGVFRCGECGCFITIETQKGHNYLRCTKRVKPCTQKCVREEAMAIQVDHQISRVALEVGTADKMISVLEIDRARAVEGQVAAKTRLKAELTACEKQIDLLLDMRLDEQITEPEYVLKKHILVNRKAELKGKLEALEDNRRNRFEPVIQFVNEAKQATFLLAEGNLEKRRDFLKKVGSNLQVADKSLAVEFKNPWKYVAEFNSDPITILARQRGNLKKVNWRCLLDKVRTFFEENPLV